MRAPYRKPRQTLADALTAGDRAWMRDAACRPRAGYEGFTEQPLVVQLAHCHGCPVTVQCATYALETHTLVDLRVCEGIAYGGRSAARLARPESRERVAS